MNASQTQLRDEGQKPMQNFSHMTFLSDITVIFHFKKHISNSLHLSP